MNKGVILSETKDPYHTLQNFAISIDSCVASGFFAAGRQTSSPLRSE
jgi:hypothetical protein